MKNKHKIFKVLLFSFSFVAFFSLSFTKVFGQAQDFNFSGSQPESYQCIHGAGVQDLVGSPGDYGSAGGIPQDSTGRYICKCGDNPSSLTTPTLSNGIYYCPGRIPASQAVLKPPKLQQVEIWFVRILYVIWALVASLSFFFLVVLGYRYMISRGDVTKITEIRQKIVYYIIGLALVFLAVPILGTIFRLLAVNTAVECYNVAIPGFQFFFSNLCTDPLNVITDPCTASSGPTGIACPGTGQSKVCPRAGAYCCTSNQVWTSYEPGTNRCCSVDQLSDPSITNCTR